MKTRMPGSRIGASPSGERARLVAPHPRPIIELQRTAGNGAVGALIQRCANGRPCAACAAAAAERPQRDLRRLTISRPDDRSEHEAERVADRVMRTAAPVVHRKCASCGDEEHKLHRKALDTPAADRAAGGAVPAVVHQALEAGGGRPLDPGTRAFFEPRFGADFSHVRVHTNGRAVAAARSVSARAFTVGRDVVFGQNQYAPTVETGRRLLAHELTHVLQQGPALLQRACGERAIGSPTGCIARDPTFVPGHLFKFNRGCDDFAARPPQEKALLGFVAALPATATVQIHGFASMDGPAPFNSNLACARALKALAVLTGKGRISASRITGVFSHGPTPGTAADRRSVTIVATTPPKLRRHRFRAAAASFLSCALCNPFTDDGTLGVAPPVTEPAPGSSLRQKHHVEAELGTFDARTIAPGTTLVTSGTDIGVSHFCGVGAPAHVVSSLPPGPPLLVTSSTGVQGIQVERELSTRVGATVLPTLPGAPCGPVGTNPLIPVIGNRFRMRLFADGTKESEFVSATLYPSHLLYEDGALKMFRGAPVHPATDFFAWAASSPAPGGLPAAILGFKAMRFACCNPALSAIKCGTVCVGGFSVPGPGFSPIALAAHVRALHAAPCPTPCAPAGASCPPIVRPSNP